MDSKTLFKDSYDVVIIGAGPGGLRCAEILSRSQLSVLLIEKNVEIGPKICAGGLTRKSLKLLGLPDELIEYAFSQIVFRTKYLHSTVDFGEKYIYTISRRRLGQWQLGKLKNTTVAVLAGTGVAGIGPESVTLADGQHIGYRFLVGADGSNSLVRKFLKIPTVWLGVGCQHIIPQQFSDLEIFFNSHLFHSWYSWIFPYKDSTSVGYGFFYKIVSGLKAKAKFEIWSKSRRIDLAQGEFQAHPINCDYRGFAFGNRFLVGDAAGLTSGFTGEGIFQAMKSGEEVAKKILDQNYSCPGIKRILHEKRVNEILLSILIFMGPLRELAFYLIVILVRFKPFGRFLLRILT